MSRNEAPAPRSRRRAIGLVEVLLAASILGTAAVSLLTMTQEETSRTIDLRDQVQAACLARNVLEVLAHSPPPAKLLSTAHRQADGTFLIEDALQEIPQLPIALGEGLFRWALAKQSGLGLDLKLRISPEARDGGDLAGTHGRLVLCTLAWGRRRASERVRLSRLVGEW